MQKNYLSLVALISLSVASLSVRAASFADAVVGYDPGSLSGSAVSFTNATAALGEPSRVTPGPFGGAVDPFNPPYLESQLVAIGQGGSVTVRFNSPILNNPGNPHGLDFIIYGNAGFVITNGDFSGGGITDGSLFGNNTGSTRVSVSADNVSYFSLNPSRASVVDELYPTDGSGDFARAVNPALGKVDFSGQDLAGIRALYDGSGGGTGFDISWAQDSAGQDVNLPAINFIRVDVLTGKSEIDAFAVVPEPSVWALALVGTGIFWMRRPRFMAQRWMVIMRPR
ncbi:MAG: hypothetical protein ABI651_17820 [Verrucomicrobiota bacterium]